MYKLLRQKNSRRSFLAYLAIAMPLKAKAFQLVGGGSAVDYIVTDIFVSRSDQLDFHDTVECKMSPVVASKYSKTCRHLWRQKKILFHGRKQTRTGWQSVISCPKNVTDEVLWCLQFAREAMFDAGIASSTRVTEGVNTSLFTKIEKYI